MAAVAAAALCPALLAGTSAAAARRPVAAGGRLSASGGSWGRARKVPGLAALNTRGDAVLYEVSCGAAGSCSAGGFYTDGSGHGQAFVVSQHNGTWNHAEEVPGTAALNAGGDTVTSSVSCASAGNRSAVGSYKDRSGHHQAFIAIQAR